MADRETPDKLLELATDAHRAGRYQEAEGLYREAVARDTRNVAALYRLGVLHLQEGRLDEALRFTSEAVAVNPRSPEALSNKASVLMALGRHEEALSLYDAALALEPDDIDYRFNRATVLLELDRNDDALQLLSHLANLRPNDTEILGKRAVALLKIDRPGEALVIFDQILRDNNSSADVLINRGKALFALDRVPEALASYEAAHQADPSNSVAQLNRCVALQRLKKFDEALQYCDQVLVEHPRHLMARKRRALILMALQRYEEAVQEFSDYCFRCPNDNEAAAMCVSAAYAICNWLVGEPAKAVVLQGCRKGFYRDVPPLILLSACDDTSLQAKAARAYVDSQPSKGSNISPVVALTPRPKLRVGYLSADFGEHPIGYLCGGLFELHDRTRFEVYGFVAHTRRDDMNVIAKRIGGSFDIKIPVENLSDEKLCEKIRAADIDILVDLGGHTDRGRILALASRPARIQATYLGYAGSVGADFIDYAIVDKFVVPPTEAHHYSEKLLYLPECFQVNDRDRPIGRLPTRKKCRLPNDAFVFCAFNNPVKLNPAMFDVWMRILHSVPGSVLWLNRCDAAAQANLKREAAARGADPARLIFAKRAPSMPEHLARQGVADLFLDCWPYNAHTTASDALWAGLPVLTYSGSCYAARVGGSLLHAIGLPELVTYSLEDYEDLAIRLARSPAQLGELRCRLEKNREVMPLFDTLRFVRHLERGFEAMWETYVAQRAPANLTVSLMS